MKYTYALKTSGFNAVNRDMGGLVVGGKSPLAALVEGSLRILLLDAAPKRERLGIKSASFTKVGGGSSGSEPLKPASSVNVAHDSLIFRVNILKIRNLNAQCLDLLQFLPCIPRIHGQSLEASDVIIKGHVNVILRTPKEHSVEYWVVELPQDVRKLIDDLTRIWLFLAAEQVLEYAHDSLFFLPNVKEHASSPAGASDDSSEKPELSPMPENRAAGDGCVTRIVVPSSSYPMDAWTFEYFDAENGETLSKFSLNAKLIHRPDAIERVINRVLEDLRKKHGELPLGWFEVGTSTQENDRASTSDEVPMRDRAGKAIAEWNRGSRSMGIGLRQVDRRGHLRPRSESPSRNLGEWLGQQVLETWDCGLDGMKLVLDGDKEVSLTSREFYAWNAGLSSLHNV